MPCCTMPPSPKPPPPPPPPPPPKPPPPPLPAAAHAAAADAAAAHAAAADAAAAHAAAADAAAAHAAASQAAAAQPERIGTDVCMNDAGTRVIASVDHNDADDAIFGTQANNERRVDYYVWDYDAASAAWSAPCRLSPEGGLRAPPDGKRTNSLACNSDLSRIVIQNQAWEHNGGSSACGYDTSRTQTLSFSVSASGRRMEEEGEQAGEGVNLVVAPYTDANGKYGLRRRLDATTRRAGPHYHNCMSRDGTMVGVIAQRGTLPTSTLATFRYNSAVGEFEADATNDRNLFVARSEDDALFFGSACRFSADGHTLAVGLASRPRFADDNDPAWHVNRLARIYLYKHSAAADGWVFHAAVAAEGDDTTGDTLKDDYFGDVMDLAQVHDPLSDAFRMVSLDWRAQRVAVFDVGYAPNGLVHKVSLAVRGGAGATAAAIASTARTLDLSFAEGKPWGGFDPAQDWSMRLSLVPPTSESKIWAVYKDGNAGSADVDSQPHASLERVAGDKLRLTWGGTGGVNSRVVLDWPLPSPPPSYSDYYEIVFSYDSSAYTGAGAASVADGLYVLMRTPSSTDYGLRSWEDKTSEWTRTFNSYDQGDTPGWNVAPRTRPAPRLPRQRRRTSMTSGRMWTSPSGARSSTAGAPTTSARRPTGSGPTRRRKRHRCRRRRQPAALRLALRQVRQGAARLRQRADDHRRRRRAEAARRVRRHDAADRKPKGRALQSQQLGQTLPQALGGALPARVLDEDGAQGPPLQKGQEQADESHERAVQDARAGPLDPRLPVHGQGAAAEARRRRRRRHSLYAARPRAHRAAPQRERPLRDPRPRRRHRQ